MKKFKQLYLLKGLDASYLLAKIFIPGKKIKDLGTF